MFKNYMIIALRNFYMHESFSLLACAVILLAFSFSLVWEAFLPARGCVPHLVVKKAEG